MSEHMSEFWHISKKYRNTALIEVFADLGKTFSVRGEQVTRNPVGRVIKVEIDGHFYFVKLYSWGGRRLRRFLGKSRVRAEWENLLFFSELGISTADLVAYGEELKWGLFRRGALITEELKNTTDMAELVQTQSPLLRDKNWLMQVCLQVADFTKRLHENGFAHYDLKWRNILVNNEKKPKVFFIDCPMGKKRFGAFLQRGIIKDLACLDKVAKYQMSKTDRLRFYKAYCGHNKLTRDDKQLIRKVLVFFSGRE